MSVRCAKCGEELLGAVNRCWKCGSTFARRPEADGLPPVRVEWQTQPGNALDAVILEDLPPATETAEPAADLPARAVPQPPQVAQLASPYVMPRPKTASEPSGAQRVEAHRQSLIAMGGTVTSLVLGVFGLALAFFRFEAAIIALIGLLMGVWGLYSQKRNWALLAMLLCAVAITLGTYRGVRDLYIYIKEQQPIDAIEPDVVEDP
jgi:hypothetical protein